MTNNAHTKNVMLKAKLHPVWVPRGGYRYSVIFRGELLVDRSRDPECDAARALVAKGITGRLTMLDGKTGKPRIVIDIERAAQLCVKEGPSGSHPTRAVQMHHRRLKPMKPLGW